MELTMTCDRDKDENDVRFEENGSDACTLKAAAVLRRACPIFSLTYLFEKYPYIFSLVFMGAGILITFFGLKFFKIVLFLLATFVVSFLLLTIIYQMALSKYVNMWVFWVCLGLSTLVGLTVGYFVAAYDRYCFVLAGACLGGVAGFIIYTACFASIVASVCSMVYKLVVDGLRDNYNRSRGVRHH